VDQASADPPDVGISPPINALKCWNTLNERMHGPKGEAQDVRNK